MSACSFHAEAHERSYIEIDMANMGAKGGD